MSTSPFSRAFLGWLLLLLPGAVAAAPTGADPLLPYRGRNRMLVLFVPDQPGARRTLAAWEASLRRENAGLAERDVLVVHAGPLSGKPTSRTLSLDATGRAMLRRRFQLEGAEPRVVLVGKDGGVKRRLAGERLDLRALFALIDTMPMRREEMRRPR